MTNRSISLKSSTGPGTMATMCLSRMPIYRSVVIWGFSQRHIAYRERERDSRERYSDTWPTFKIVDLGRASQVMYTAVITCGVCRHENTRTHTHTHTHAHTHTLYSSFHYANMVDGTSSVLDWGTCSTEAYAALCTLNTWEVCLCAKSESDLVCGNGIDSQAPGVCDTVYRCLAVCLGAVWVEGAEEESHWFPHCWGWQIGPLSPLSKWS